MPACPRLVAVALALAACGGRGTTARTPTPPPAAPSPAARFELGEMTVFDGPDPMVKVHADGSTELGSRATPTAWKPGPKLNPDGTIASGGKLVARLDADGTIFDLTSNQPEPLKVGDDQLELTTHGQVTTIALAADGKVTITNPPGTLHAQPPHVEGADTPGKRRAVLTLIGLIVGGHAEVSTHVETSPAPAASLPPASEWKPAPTP